MFKPWIIYHQTPVVAVVAIVVVQNHPLRKRGEVRQTSCTKKNMESNEVSLKKIQPKSYHIHHNVVMDQTHSTVVKIKIIRNR